MSSSGEPVRTCTGCGSRRGKKEMIRIVADPSGNVIPDLKGKLPGRGGYVCPERKCVEKSAGRLSSTLKSAHFQTVSGSELARILDEALKNRVLSLLGLARKSGKIVSGTNLVTGELKRKPRSGAMILIAEDASDETCRKIESAAEGSGVVIEQFLTREAIGQAIGKGLRSVVLVEDTGFVETLSRSIKRCKAVAFRERKLSYEQGSG